MPDATPPNPHQPGNSNLGNASPSPESNAPNQQAALDFLRDEGQANRKAQVTVQGGSVTITESAEELFRAIAPTKQLFYRGGVLVELVNEGEGYTVQVVDAVAAQSRFEKYVRFFKNTKMGENSFPTPTTISETTAKQYLKSEACRDLLPKLNGVLQCPLLVEKDGRLHSVEQGYDEETGFFVATSQPPNTIELVQAVEFLSGMLNGFDFVTPGDRSRAIASLLTPALKLGGLITGPVPVDVAEANASQSGKSYRQRVVAALYNQKPAVVTKRVGGVGSMEEVFSDHLVKGRVFVQFDNVRGKLDSQYLESFLTAEGTFPARIPYHGTIIVDPSKFILFISSNGFEATKDLTNRASIIRIRKRENYQFRLLDGKDLVQLVFEWQPILMGSVFAVLQEWYRQGKPKTNETRHDFREWCQVLDWIVQNLFHAAPLMEGHDQAKQRAANPNLSFLRLVAIKLNDQNRLNQQTSASDIAELCLEEDFEIPGLSAENQTVEQGPQQIGRIMGGLFKDTAEVLFDEFRVVREQERGRNEAGNIQTLNRYTFSLVNPVTPAPNAANPPTATPHTPA